jgi:hypothetical protein
MIIFVGCSPPQVSNTNESTNANESTNVIPNGSGNYEDLISLFHEFLTWKDPRKESDLYPDYSEEAVGQRRDEMKEFHARLLDMAVSDWDISKQSEYLAVRSRFNQHDFLLNISKPWSRDPGFYVDQMLRITFTDFPIEGDALESLRTQLAGISILVRQAKQNLTEAAADYTDLAIFNLTNPDGVGHGFPYREVPPAGVIGWYADFLERAETQQPELLSDITTAKNSVEGYLDFLNNDLESMTKKGGVGREAFDWYLKHVKLMSYTADDIVLLGKRELDRLWSVYALELHRNRNLPVIDLPTSAEDRDARNEKTDKNVRRFLIEQEIITIPDYIPEYAELGTNVPWIDRSGGPNFWEQIQWRDPHPDHLHAVIPGHRFDGVVARNSTHPIRSKITSGARTEGWGVYLEEGMVQAGVLEVANEVGDIGRVRELIYLFGIFRAARVPADVWLQLNEMSVSEVVDYWIEKVPFMDEDVARVDAEIYLRRPPGYGLGYTVGMLQMQNLLSDRKQQLGDNFVLKEFHDTLMSLGRLPLSLLRFEMTGLDDEIQNFWVQEPLPSN